MSESTGVGTALSGYVRQVGRGLVYLFILQYSVGIAVRIVVERAVGPTPISTPGVISTVVVVTVAGLLVNSPNPPSYRRLTGFTLVALGVESPPRCYLASVTDTSVRCIRRYRPS